MTSKVTVKLVSARGLLARDRTGSSDPYVHLKLGKKSRKSAVHKQTLEPDFKNETLTIVSNVMKNKVLQVLVYDWDMITSNDFLGKHDVPLANYGPHYAPDEFEEVRVKLKSKNGTADKERGELIFKIRVERLFDKSSVMKYVGKLKVPSGKFWEDPDFNWDANEEKRANLIELGGGRGLVKVFQDSSEPDDVVQGALGTCWLLSAAAVARQEILSKLFVHIDIPKGIFVVRFYKCGWYYVAVDAWVPVSGEKPKYAHSRDPKELWVALLEKAYAKMHGGSYKKIESGVVADALLDLTGEPVERHTLDSHVQCWTLLEAYQKEKYLVGCSARNDKTTEQLHEEDNGRGILLNHAYSVLFCGDIGTKLVQLRNPWGKVEWKGDWSDQSPLWQQGKNKKKMESLMQGGGSFKRLLHGKMPLSEKEKLRRSIVDKDDGIFWMDIQDFVQNFSTLYVCKMLTDKHGRRWDRHKWTSKTLAGADLATNPQFAVRARHPNTTLYISLIQLDTRFTGKSDYDGVLVSVLRTSPNQTSKVPSEEDAAVVGKIKSETIMQNFRRMSGGVQSFFGSSVQACKKYQLSKDDFLFPPPGSTRHYKQSRTVNQVYGPLDQDEEVILLVSTYDNRPLDFHLMVNADSPVDAKELKDRVPDSVFDQWTASNSGGCKNHTTYWNNPVFILKVPSSGTKLTLVLTQTDKDENNAAHVGLEVGRGRAPSKETALQDSGLHTNSVKCAISDLKLDSGEYWVLASCYEPGTIGRFSVDAHVHGHQTVTLTRK